MRKRNWLVFGASLLGIAMAAVGSADELTFVDRVVESGVLSGARSVGRRHA